MPKEKQKYKKPTLLRKIARWLGLVLVCLFLITAIIFQVSWKATALLLIMLLAYTVLPKTARKWFELSVAAVILALIIWVFLPDDNENWQPFAFDEELAAFEAGFHNPDSQNAAPLYNRLLEDYDSRKTRLTFLPAPECIFILSQPWLSREHPILTEWLQGHEKTISALTKACNIKMCRFGANLKLRTTDKLVIYRRQALKSWAVLLLLAGNNDRGQGRLDQALEKYLFALRIADHLDQQKQTNDLLMGFSIEGVVLPPLNRFVIETDASEEQLKLISGALKNIENNWCSDFSKCLEYDKFFVKNVFCNLAYQTNPQGRTRFSRDIASAISRRRLPSQTYWQKKSMKACAIGAWFFFPTTPQKTAQMIDKIFENAKALTDPNFPWGTEDLRSLPRFQLNCSYLIESLTNRSTRLYPPFHDVYLKRLAQRRAARLITAIKSSHIANSRWPETLDSIKSDAPPEAFIDPLNGGPFVYKLNGDDFILYSKGRNNIDEDGKREREGPDDLTIWPPDDRKPENNVEYSHVEQQ